MIESAARRGLLLSAGVAMAAAAGHVHAQGGAAGAGYPTRPVRLVVPFPAGGATDILSRVVAQKLSASLGQQVIVDNRPGAGGAIGSDAVAKAAPDGYTLLMATSSTHSIGPAITPKLPYDAFKDFAPIIELCSSPAVLVVGADFPAKTAREFVALLKSNPGRYNFGSSGIGTNPHLIAELFKAQAGNLYAVHIPYRGTQLVIPDLISGQVAFLMDNIVSTAPHVRDGKLRALGVASNSRSNVLPDVPTLKESGIDGMDVPTWFGMFAPSATPPAIIARLNGDMNAMLETPDMLERLGKLGADAAGGPPDVLRKVSRDEYEKWLVVIRRANIKPE